MRRFHLLAAAALFGAWALAQGQTPGVDPEAAQRLQAATDFVAAQARFSVDTHSTIEGVLDSGQKIQFDHAARLSVQRPNKLRAERSGDLVEQVLQYDGAWLSLHNPHDGVYARVAAPDNLEAALDFAHESLDLVAPAGDLIYFNAYAILMNGVENGFVVGKSQVAGVRCDHLAFRGADSDWQIWIQEGDQPLPRKLVITTRDLPSAPQFTVVMTQWDLDPAFDDSLFLFTPPAGSLQIEFLPVATAAAQTE